MFVQVLKKIVNWKIILGFITLFIFAGLRQLQYDDSIFHISRIMQMAENIKNGWMYPFPSYFSVMGGAGYSLPIFYGDLFLLPAAFVFIITKSIRITIFLNDLFIYFFILTSSLYVFKKMKFENAFYLSILYFANISVGVTFFMNGNIAFCLSAAFIPLVFYYYYLITYRKENCIISLSFSMAGLFLSHIISTYLVVLLLTVNFIYLAIKKKITISIFVNLLKSALLSIGITAYFWLPMIEQNLHYNTKVSNMGLSGSLLEYDYSSSVKTFSEFLIMDNFLYGNIVDILFVISLILWILNIRNAEHRKYWNLFILIFIINIFQYIPFFAGLMEPIFGIIQNVRRFDIIVSFFEIIYIGLMLNQRYNNIVNIRNILLMHFLMLGLFILNNNQELFNNSFYNTNRDKVLELSKTDDINKLDTENFRKRNKNIQIGMGEYLPEKFNASYLIDTNNYINKNYNFKRNGSSAVFDTKSKEVIELPIVYQYGYHAEQNGKEIELRESLHGLLEVVSEKEGKVIITYKRTATQIISIVISLSLLIAVMCFSFIRYFKNKQIGG